MDVRTMFAGSHTELSVTLSKHFSHPSLAVYSFATPPIKLKLGQQIGGRLLIANHMDQPLWWVNQKYWAAVRSYLLHSFLFCRCAALLRLVPATVPSAIMLRQNQFPESNRYRFDFFHPFLLCRITYWALLEMLLELLRYSSTWSLLDLQFHFSGQISSESGSHNVKFFIRKFGES